MDKSQLFPIINYFDRFFPGLFIQNGIILSPKISRINGLDQIKNIIRQIFLNLQHFEEIENELFLILTEDRDDEICAVANKTKEIFLILYMSEC
ncbi:MAG: hypothetical protein OEY49_00115 [Candidatus Heimdallarchaeota archaeon]|nr:hypothetical protein [Candidatus Heimdallarchaeota archaeon]